MTVLSPNLIAAHAAGAGFGALTNIAVAVALAESGGDTQSHNSTPPDDSYGLWQINMLGSLGPARRKEFNLKSNEDLFNPDTNARVAHGIFQKSGWKAWTTYTSGKYKQFLPQANQALLGENKDGSPASSPEESSPIGEAANAIGKTFLNTGASIGGLVVALVLLVLGVVLLARKPLMNVLPAGKALKAVKAVS
jgi:lysozyme-like protein